MMRFCIVILACVATINCTPVERKGPMVVDVPAGIFDGEPEALSDLETVKGPTPAVVETVDAGNVDVIPPKKPDSFDSSVSVENVEIPDRGSDFFGFRLPPIFMYRRPVIKDPFLTSFPSFSTFSQPQQPAESSPSSFNMMTHMEKMMQRMQQQMSSLWGALLSPTPSYNRNPFRPNFPVDSAESKDNDTVVSFDNLPANYKNSTSETKLIDGQLVTVNKTVHKISSNNSSGFFQVQVINIRPQGPYRSRTTEKPATAIPEAVPSTIEEKLAKVPVEDTVETTVAPSVDPSLNEVDALNNDDQLAEDKDKIANVEGFRYGYETSGEGPQTVEVGFIPLEKTESPNRRVRQQRVPIDLSSDIRVNKLMEELQQKSGHLRKIDDDVEILDI